MTVSRGTFANTPQENFGYEKLENRTGERSVKRPLPVISPSNPYQTAGAQGTACTRCKENTCSSLGCPMGKDIGGANIMLGQAGDVANRAFKLLKEYSDQDAEDIIRLISSYFNREIPDYAAPTDALFERLRKYDSEAAERYERHFNQFMYDTWIIFGGAEGRGRVYGRACPAKDLLCQSKCQIEFAMARGVTIPMNEAAVDDYAWAKGFVKPIQPLEEKLESVALIGSGSAATHAALELRKKGYQVTIFEKNELPGELGDGKIHPYKVDQEIWQSEHQWLKDSGIKFQLGTPVGTVGISVEKISKEFNVIAFCTGTPFANDHGLTGDAADSVVLSNEYLKQQQEAIYRRKYLSQKQFQIPKEYLAAGKNVIINGHGDTAVDCARVAVIQGARSVTLVSRHEKINARDLNNTDFDAFHQLEIEAGSKLGFQYHTALKECTYGQNNLMLRGVSRAPDTLNESVNLITDMPISAIGNIVGDLPKIFGLKNLPLTKYGTLLMQLPGINRKTYANGFLGGFIGRDRNGMAYFGAGEVITGPSLLVKAGEGGKIIGRQIDEFFQSQDNFYKKVEDKSGQPVFEIF